MKMMFPEAVSFWHFVSELLGIVCYCFDIFPDCRHCCVSWEPGKSPRNETCCCPL